jgi:hypothetical protein
MRSEAAQYGKSRGLGADLPWLTLERAPPHTARYKTGQSAKRRSIIINSKLLLTGEGLRDRSVDVGINFSAAPYLCVPYYIAFRILSVEVGRTRLGILSVREAMFHQ